MNKKFFSIVLVNLTLMLIFCSCFSTVAGSFNISTNASKSNVYIYVNSTIAANIQSEILQYKTDLELDGYNVTVYNWTDTNPDLYSRVSKLKENLTAEYHSNNLTGAVFIGNFPYLLFEGDQEDQSGNPTPVYGTFPSDLYLMDLDGNWTDTGGLPGFLDTHFNVSFNDVYPEIFIARINPEPITGINVTQALIKYFERNHQFRIQNITNSDSGLMFIDDTWETWSHEWIIDIKYLYSNVTLINNTYPIIRPTDASYYMSELKKQYEWVQLFCHSNATYHGFDWISNPPPAMATFMNSTMDIAPLNPKAWFYNLYCCHANRYIEPDNLGTHYLFSSNNTLSVFGCARSGGFNLNQYLYEPISQGKSFGEAFFNWWFNDILDPIVKTHGPTANESRGNCLLGDPFIILRKTSVSTPQSPLIPGFEILFITIGLITVLGYAIWTKRRNQLNTL
ncbi:MAG: hypothetical protein EAX96_03600 [Candidatus Lokiarchaeota archaeon]|nr:hypothetical protein [Candidatus Lokiarchaeota archaeon]